MKKVVKYGGYYDAIKCSRCQTCICKKTADDNYIDFWNKWDHAHSLLCPNCGHIGFTRTIARQVIVYYMKWWNPISWFKPLKWDAERGDEL